MVAAAAQAHAGGYVVRARVLRRQTGKPNGRMTLAGESGATRKCVRRGSTPAGMEDRAGIKGGVVIGRRPLEAPRHTRGSGVTARAADGDWITSLGEFVGVGLGVVGLSFVAGLNSAGKEAGEEESLQAVAAASGPTQNAKASGKQTIAGGVVGANNPKKAFPGMPKKPSGKVTSAAEDASDSAIIAALASRATPGTAGGDRPKKEKAAAGKKSDLLSVLTDGFMGGVGRPAAAQSYPWGAAEAMGPREYMEDAWCVKDTGFAGGYFFASVMDGHGGAASSAYLRENLFDLLNAEARRAPSGLKASAPGAAPDGTPGGGYLAESLAGAFEKADETLIDHIARLGEPECWSGSTCTSVLVREDRVVVANVGDSRAILIRKQKGIELTQDHRPVGSSKAGRKELERVTRAGGWSVGGRVCGILAVSRAFGDYEFKGGRFDLLEDLSEEPLAKNATLEKPPVVATPDVCEVAREPGADEWLVLASDGLWDTLNTQQCATFIKQELRQKPAITADELANSLVKRAIRFRTQDNIAVVVVDLREPALE